MPIIISKNFYSSELLEINRSFVRRSAKKGNKKLSPPYTTYKKCNKCCELVEENRSILFSLSVYLLRLVDLIGLEQVKDQPHQFTGCKRKGTFIGKFFRLRLLFRIVLGKYRVVRPDTVSRFDEIVF